MYRLLRGGLLAILVVACGGAAAPTARPAASIAPGGGQQTPGGPAATTAPGGAAGSSESIARSLVPPGTTEITHVGAGNQYTVSVSSNDNLTNLQSYFDQKIPVVGLSQTGKLVSGDTVTYAFTNPDGGIVIAGNGSGQYLITISVGTSS